MAGSPTFFTAGTQAGAAGLSLLSGPLLTRSVGADGRGIVAGVTVTLTLLSWVCFIGVPQSLGYHAETQRSVFVNRMAALTFALGAGCGALLWVAAPALVNGGPALQVDGLRVAAVLLPLSGLALCGQELSYAAGRLVQWNLVRAVPTAGASLGIIILFLVGSLDLFTGLASYLVAFAAYCVLGGVQLAVRMGRKTEDVSWQRALRYAGATWMASSSLALFGRLDQFLMVPFSTAERLGRYAVAVTVVASANLIPSAIGVVSYSKTRLAKESARENWRQSRRRLVVLGGAANIVVVVVGPWLVPTLFGHEFEGMWLIIAVLALGQLTNDVWILRVNTLSGVGKQNRAVAPSWVSTVVFAAALSGLGWTGEITELEAALATLACALIRPVVSRARWGPYESFLIPSPTPGTARREPATRRTVHER